ncbi:MAG: hypothetical protein KDH86_11995, partial [Anaerolineae bacterium]|nr:hypothetical protein [Anaerolineae bacterium]
EAWFLIMLGATIIIAGLMAFTRGDVAYLLVLVWALAGIAVKHSDVQSLAMAAAVAAGIVVVFVIIGVVRRGSRPPVPAAAA